MDSTSFWSYFGRLDNILGVATVILAAYSAYRLHRENIRRQALVRESFPVANFRELVEAHLGVKSLRPVAFSLCLLDKNDSIKADVATFLNAQGMDMPIEELNMNGINGTGDLELFINSLKEKRRDFESKGYTEIHLFIAGPTQAGTIIGGMFRNWIPVKLYQKPNPPPPQIYEYWMPLL